MRPEPLVGKAGAADSDVGVNHKLQLKLQVPSPHELSHQRTIENILISVAHHVAFNPRQPFLNITA
jgi:hypothetical protein